MSFPNIPQKDPGLLNLVLYLAFLMVRHSPYVAGAILPEVGILVNSPRKLRIQKSICLLDCKENSMCMPDCIRELHLCARLHRELCVCVGPHREPYRYAGLHREERVECIMDGGSYFI